MRFLRRLFALLLLCTLGAGVWLYRDRIAERLGRGVEAREPVTPELAESADEKIARLRTGDARIALSGAELESLLRYRYDGVLPAFVEATRIDLKDDQFRMDLRVPVDHVPTDILGRAVGLLPDTVNVALGGRLLPFGERRAAVLVENVAVAGIPIPARLIPALLERLGRADEEGLPRDAMVLPLPPGAGAVYVRGDSLILATGVAGAGS